jgi:hypothetical protein
MATPDPSIYFESQYRSVPRVFCFSFPPRTGGDGQERAVFQAMSWVYFGKTGIRKIMALYEKEKHGWNCKLQGVEFEFFSGPGDLPDSEEDRERQLKREFRMHIGMENV